MISFHLWQRYKLPFFLILFSSLFSLIHAATEEPMAYRPGTISADGTTLWWQADGGTPTDAIERSLQMMTRDPSYDGSPKETIEKGFLKNHFAQSKEALARRASAAVALAEAQPHYAIGYTHTEIKDGEEHVSQNFAIPMFYSEGNHADKKGDGPIIYTSHPKSVLVVRVNRGSYSALSILPREHKSFTPKTLVKIHGACSEIPQVPVRSCTMIQERVQLPTSTDIEVFRDAFKRLDSSSIEEKQEARHTIMGALNKEELTLLERKQLLDECRTTFQKTHSASVSSFLVQLLLTHGRTAPTYPDEGSEFMFGNPRYQEILERNHRSGDPFASILLGFYSYYGLHGFLQDATLGRELIEQALAAGENKISKPFGGYAPMAERMTAGAGAGSSSDGDAMRIVAFEKTARNTFTLLLTEPSKRHASDHLPFTAPPHQGIKKEKETAAAIAEGMREASARSGWGEAVSAIRRALPFPEIERERSTTADHLVIPRQAVEALSKMLKHKAHYIKSMIAVSYHDNQLAGKIFTPTLPFGEDTLKSGAAWDYKDHRTGTDLTFYAHHIGECELLLGESTPRFILIQFTLEKAGSPAVTTTLTPFDEEVA